MPTTIDHYHQLPLKPICTSEDEWECFQGEESFVDPISPWVLALDLTFTLPLPVGRETLLVAAPNNQEEPLETPVASR